MKKLYTSVLTAMVLASSTLSYADEQAMTAPQPVTLSEKYTNTEKNYSIEYPTDWKKNDVPRLDLVLFAPSKGPDANSHASMNIVSEKVGPGITLEQFYSESASNLTTALKDVQVEKTGNSQLNGVPTKWLLYTHVMQNIKFRVMQYFMVAQETVFLLTFSAVAENFDSYKPEFEAIANSFKLVKSAPLIAPAATPVAPPTPKATTPEVPTTPVPATPTAPVIPTTPPPVVPATPVAPATK